MAKKADQPTQPIEVLEQPDLQSDINVMDGGVLEESPEVELTPEQAEVITEAVVPTRELLTDSLVDYRRNRLFEKQQIREQNEPGVRAVL